MDALALLCNLHGDGPVTMAALRDIGCEDLLGLEAIGDQMLEQLLRRDSSGVARFRREARLLHERIEGECLVEVEPKPVELLEPEPSVEVEAELIPASQSVADESSPAPQGQAGSPVVDAVLELWRSFDQDSVDLDHQGVQAPIEADADTEELSAQLSEVEINGLRATELEALAGAGIVTLAQFAEADPLVLSRQIGLAYTHLAHLAYLARKLHQRAQGMIPAKAPSGVRGLQSISMPPDESAAGPFA